MLIRLYSETNLLLKDVVFDRGVNIVLGKYSRDKNARGPNGIGKSSLVRLIGYCLLSSNAEALFRNPKYDFLRKEDHSLVLEFAVRNKRFFIKRYFSQESTAFFGSDINKLEKYETSDLKKILANIFFPFENTSVFFQGNRFGTLIEFFLKDDLHNQQRNDPLNFTSFNQSARDKAIYNFFLLDLSTEKLIQFASVAKEYEDYKRTIKGLEDKILADTGKPIEEFKSEKLKIESKILLLENSLKEYNFFESNKAVEKDLIEITTKISDTMMLYYATDDRLKRIKESYKTSQEVNVEELKLLFNETVQTFGDLVKKTLREITEFKTIILENRNKFLFAKEQELQKIIDNLLKQLAEYETQRGKLYKRLKDKGALAGIESAYESLIVEKTRLERNSQILLQIDELNEILADSDVVLSQFRKEILDEVKSYDGAINDLRRLFQDILVNAIFLDENLSNAYFDISANNKSPKTQMPFKIDVEVPKVDAQGQHRFRILAYDLMVFLKNMGSKRIFPDFLIHDGAFHAIAHKTVANTLNYMYHKSLEYKNFQYLVTFNEDEVEVAKDMEEAFGKFDFDWKKHVVAEYADVPEQMIFKRAFS